MPNFKDKVLKVVAGIPKGKVMTYKHVAKLANKPRAYRTVGSILSANWRKNIPCHRVIRSDGEIGGYNRGMTKKKFLLRKEGYEI